MTNDEAICILKPFMTCMFDQRGCPISDGAIALDLAITALERDRRISVETPPDTNRNPMTTNLYLVLCNEWGHARVRICAYYSEAEKWIQDGKNITEYVTHWMPLPEPPKEETRNCLSTYRKSLNSTSKRIGLMIACTV